jgi:hypothetical protein
VDPLQNFLINVLGIEAAQGIQIAKHERLRQHFNSMNYVDVQEFVKQAYQIKALIRKGESEENIAKALNSYSKYDRLDSDSLKKQSTALTLGWLVNLDAFSGMQRHVDTAVENQLFVKWFYKQRLDECPPERIIAAARLAAYGFLNDKLLARLENTEYCQKIIDFPSFHVGNLNLVERAEAIVLLKDVASNDSITALVNLFLRDALTDAQIFIRLPAGNQKTLNTPFKRAALAGMDCFREFIASGLELGFIPMEVLSEERHFEAVKKITCAARLASHGVLTSARALLILENDTYFEEVDKLQLGKMNDGPEKEAALASIDKKFPPRDLSQSMSV